MSNIKINPLHGLLAASPKRKRCTRPKWMCKHTEAILVNREKCHYKCSECNPGMGIITVIPNVSPSIKSPKKVHISPSDTCESPKAFS
jgi:hypothetical protein